MPDQESNDRRVEKALGFLGLIIVVPPFVIYLVAQIARSLGWIA